MLSKYYSSGTRQYVKQFANRELIYKEVDDGSSDRIVHNFMLNSFEAGTITIAVSCLGFLFGAYFHTLTLGKSILFTSEIKGKGFKEKLINRIMKGQNKGDPVMTYVYSAFFLDTIAGLDRMEDMEVKRVRDKAQHNGIATFSKLVANAAYPKLFIEFLNKYKIKLNKINVDIGNKLWFSNWQQVEDLLKLQSKDKKSW